jgi:hypothetical protein
MSALTRMRGGILEQPMTTCRPIESTSRQVALPPSSPGIGDQPQLQGYLGESGSRKDERPHMVGTARPGSIATPRSGA